MAPSTNKAHGQCGLRQLVARWQRSTAVAWHGGSSGNHWRWLICSSCSQTYKRSMALQWCKFAGLLRWWWRDGVLRIRFCSWVMVETRCSWLVMAVAGLLGWCPSTAHPLLQGPTVASWGFTTRIMTRSIARTRWDRKQRKRKMQQQPLKGEEEEEKQWQ